MAPGPPLSDAGLPARRGGQTAAVAGGTPAGQDAAALLPLVGARAERRSAVHLQRHVEALPPGRRQEGWASDPHSRPVPHHEPPEQGDRRGPGPGSAGLEGPGPGADPHAYPLALAQAPRAPHGPARGAPGGAPPAQPQGGPRLSLEGRLPVLLAVRLAPLGGVVPGPVVHPHAALPARAHAEGRPHAPRPPPAPPQLVSGQRGAVQRRRRGLQQQGAGHHPPGLRIPHLSRHRSRPLPYAWGSPRTGHYPQILLRRQDFLAYSREHKRSAENDEARMRRLLGSFGQRPVGDISSEDVERLRGELSRKLSAPSANRHLALLKVTFSRVAAKTIL